MEINKNFKTDIVSLMKNPEVLYHISMLNYLGFEINIESHQNIMQKNKSNQKIQISIKFTHLETPEINSGSCIVNEKTFINIFGRMYRLAKLLYVRRLSSGKDNKG